LWETRRIVSAFGLWNVIAELIKKKKGIFLKNSWELFFFLLFSYENEKRFSSNVLKIALEDKLFKK